LQRKLNLETLVQLTGVFYLPAMKLFFLFTIALCVLSCSHQQPETTKDSTSSIHVDTTPVENPEMLQEDPDYEDFDYKIAAKSKFKKNQIQEGTCYVFDPFGVNFETSDGIVQLVPGSKVIVTSEFDKTVTDEATNAVGHLYEITDADGRTGTLSSASLLGLPYPFRKYKSLEEYTLNQLNQIDSTRYVGRRHKTDPNGGYEGENEQIEYTFENGIKLTTIQGYEGSTEFMSIPGITVQEGFYFLNSLGIIDLFTTFDDRVPNKEMENAEFKSGDEYIDVDTKINSDGSLAYISIGPAGGGCGCWYSISNQGNLVQIEIGCGC
jgi:hypothetical protein